MPTSSSRAASLRGHHPRARHSARPTRNPNALYWQVSKQIPWRAWRKDPRKAEKLLHLSTAELARMRTPQRKWTSARAAVLARSTAEAAPPPAGRKPRVTPRSRPAARTSILRLPSMARSTVKLAVRPPGRTALPAKSGKGRRPKRNPPPAFGGKRLDVLGDVIGLGSALASLGRRPMGIVALGGGALGVMIGGGLINAQLGKIMPVVSSGVARAINSAGYLGTAFALSRLPRNPATRRLLLAGGLAVTLWELVQPGATASLVAQIPGIGPLVQPTQVQVAVRTPALQANADARAAVVTAAAPWYRQGGKANPLNWLGDGVAGADDPRMPSGIPVDGIAGADGSYQAFLPAADTMRYTAPEPGVSGDLGCTVIDGAGAGMSGAGDLQEPVLTFLGNLDCPPSSRSNALTQLVNV